MNLVQKTVIDYLNMALNGSVLQKDIAGSLWENKSIINTFIVITFFLFFSGSNISTKTLRLKYFIC